MKLTFELVASVLGFGILIAGLVIRGTSDVPVWPLTVVGGLLLLAAVVKGTRGEV